MLVTTDQPPVSDPISRPILDLCVFLGSKASVDKPLLTLTVKVGTVCVCGGEHRQSSCGPADGSLENGSSCVGLTILLNTFRVKKKRITYLILRGLKEYKKKAKLHGPPAYVTEAPCLFLLRKQEVLIAWTENK